MREALEISVPKPCSQPWTSMSPRAAGRYCGTCQQEVKDFTNMSAIEIQQWFQSHEAEKTCGRFYKDQVPALLPSLYPNRTGLMTAKVFLLSLLTLPLSLKSATQLAKSKPPVAMSPVYNATTPEPSDIKRNSDSTKVLKGVIVDGEELLIGATVMIKETNLKTLTDKAGNFELDLASLETDSKPILTISYIGYLTKEVKLNLEDLKPVRIIMTECQFVLGEVVYSRKPGLFKRIFRGLVGKR